MSGQVVLYFDDQADALRFALAAGSVMAGESGQFTQELVQETTRATRICLDAVNAPSTANPGATSPTTTSSNAKKSAKAGHAA